MYRQSYRTMDNLMKAFSEATDLEREAFIQVMVKHTTTNETYEGMKMYDNKKKAEAEKESAYQKGYQMRDEAAAKFNKIHPNT